MAKKNIFRLISVIPDDLLLDPNNPRLVRDLNVGERCDDEQIMSQQKATLNYFKQQKAKDSDEVEIKELYDSMMQVGYVGVDRLVVRELLDINKYVVVEGNRRLATIKTIIANAEEGNFKKDSDRVSYEQNKKSFENIRVLLLNTKGLSKEEIDEQVDIVLGIRHFDGVKEWSPLSAAFNMYRSYKSIEPKQETFKYSADRGREIANRFSVSLSKVKKSIETYIVFQQLRETLGDVVLDAHYSLVESAIPLKKYPSFFQQHPKMLEFDEESIEKLGELCQFEERGKIDKKNYEKFLIIPRPPTFTTLGRILGIADDHDEEAIRIRARNLVAAIQRGEIDEDTKEIRMSVEDALSLLDHDIKRIEWVNELEKKLDEQEQSLPVAEYAGEGNHLLAMEELENSIQNARIIFDHASRQQPHEK